MLQALTAQELQPYEGPLCLIANFYTPNFGRRDLDNLLKGIADAFNPRLGTKPPNLEPTVWYDDDQLVEVYAKQLPNAGNGEFIVSILPLIVDVDTLGVGLCKVEYQAEADQWVVLGQHSHLALPIANPTGSKDPLHYLRVDKHAGCYLAYPSRELAHEHMIAEAYSSGAAYLKKGTVPDKVIGAMGCRVIDRLGKVLEVTTDQLNETCKQLYLTANAAWPICRGEVRTALLRGVSITDYLTLSDRVTQRKKPAKKAKAKEKAKP